MQNHVRKIISSNLLPKWLRYWKLTSEDEDHFGHKYVTGLNVDRKQFKPYGEASDGGLYFVDEVMLSEYKKYCTHFKPMYIRPVFFTGEATDTQVYVEPGKYKAPKFVLGERVLFNGRPQDFMNLQNPTIALAVLKADHDFFVKQIPFLNLSVTCWETIVEQYHTLFKYAPIQTEKMVLSVLRHRSDYFHHIHEQTEDVCLFALCRNVDIFYYIKNKTPKIVDFILGPGHWHLFVHVNNPTEEQCLEALRVSNGKIFPLLRSPSDKVCLKAIADDSDNYKHIRNPSPALTLSALKSNINIFTLIHDPTEEMILYALSRNGTLLSYVKNQTAQMCVVAVTNNFEAYVYIRIPFTTEFIIELITAKPELFKIFGASSTEQCMQLITKKPALISMVSNPTPDMYQLAVRLDGHLLHHVPYAMQTIDMVIDAINQYPDAYRSARSNLQVDRSVILAVLHKDPASIKWIQKPSIEDCFYVVNADPSLLKYVPEHFQDETMCISAVTHDPSVMKYVTNPTKAIVTA
jgi:hypothetical protein